jgi:predicted acetyltransferase
MLLRDVPQPAARDAMQDGGLTLALAKVFRVGNSPWKVPAYRFDMMVDGSRAGTVSLRIGDERHLVFYAGHIGYAVEPAWRGQRLAARAVGLLMPLARAHGFDNLWATCTPENLASRRTLELLGAVYVETVPIPVDYESYARGEREKCRYRLTLSSP